MAFKSNIIEAPVVKPTERRAQSTEHLGCPWPPPSARPSVQPRHPRQRSARWSPCIKVKRLRPGYRHRCRCRCRLPRPKHEATAAPRYAYAKCKMQNANPAVLCATAQMYCILMIFSCILHTTPFTSPTPWQHEEAEEKTFR